MTDDEELAELRQKTDRSSRLDEDARGDELGAFRDRVLAELEAIDAGERQKTLSVWDGPLAAFVAALEDTEDLEAVGTALQTELDLEADPDTLDRSEVLRLALRLGFREASPEHLEAAREAARSHAEPEL